MNLSMESVQHIDRLLERVNTFHCDPKLFDLFLHVPAEEQPYLEDAVNRDHVGLTIQRLTDKVMCFSKRYFISFQTT